METKKMLSDFVTSANLPFRIVDNTELKKLAQFCIELGAKYSNFDIDNIWFSRVSVRDHVVEICNQKKEEIKIKLKGAGPNLSISTDIWTDSVNRDSFLDVSAHWIEDYAHFNACIAFKYFFFLLEINDLLLKYSLTILLIGLCQNSTLQKISMKRFILFALNMALI